MSNGVGRPRRPRLASVSLLHVKTKTSGGKKRLTGAWSELPPLREARSGCRAVWAGAAAVTPARLVVLGGHGSAAINRGYTLSTVEALPIEEPHHPSHSPNEPANEPANEVFGGDTWLPEDGHRKGWLKKHWRNSNTHHRQFFILSHQPGRHGLWYYDHHSELDHLGLTAEARSDRRDHIAETGVQPSGIIRMGDVREVRAGLEPTRIEVVCS